MGPAFSILGLLFLFGALLFLFMLTLTVFSLKGSGRFGGRPILTAFAFAFAIALMAGPAFTLTMIERYEPTRAFRMFFGRAPVETVKILNSEAGSGTDYSRVMLVLETTSKAEFEAFADWAHLKRSGGLSAPEIAASDIPDWWRPNDCVGALAVFVGRTDANWDEKWATFCEENNRGHAYAIWIE